MAKKARKQAPKRPQQAKRPATFSERDVKLQMDVKRANQRLRELEKQGMENSPAYAAVERLALVGDPAIARTGKGEIKFNTNIRKLTYNQRRHLEAEVNRFLSSETSTTKGVKKMVEQAKQAYNKKAWDKAHNKNMDYSEWINIWRSGIVKQYKLLYGSEETFNLIIRLQDSGLTEDEAIIFLQDNFGKPLATIIDLIPHEKMDKGTSEPWDWNDIFNKADGVDDFYNADEEKNNPFK